MTIPCSASDSTSVRPGLRAGSIHVGSVSWGLTSTPACTALQPEVLQEPNNLGGKEFCAGANATMPPEDGIFGWSDEDCAIRTPFICKINRECCMLADEQPQLELLCHLLYSLPACMQPTVFITLQLQLRLPPDYRRCCH